MNKIIASMRYFSLFLFFIVLSFNCFGQDQAPQTVGPISLQEGINIAQNQSSEAVAARYDLLASKYRYKSFHADLLPSLELTGNAPNYRKSISSYRLDNGDYVFQSTRQSEAQASLSINQNILPTGGTLSLSSGINRLGIFYGENTYLWQSTPLVVGFSQPLFQFNSLKWRNETEPLRYKIAKTEYVQDMETLAQRVTQSFFDVYLAKINLENAQFNVTRNDSIYQISQGRYKVGSIAENDLLQSELRLKNAQSSLSTAHIEYDRALNEFKILLGYPTDINLKLEDPKEPPVVHVDISKAKQLALQNNSESLNYKLSEIQAKESLAQAKSEANFSADISAQYGLNQTSDRFRNVYDQPENRQFFTIDFDIPIFNWGKKRAQISAARNAQRSVANSIKVQRREFVQQVDYTVSQFLQLRQQVLLAADADTIAQRRYQVAQNRYRIGKIDITDLFNAQTDKDAARQAYVRALRTFWSGLFNLRELTHYNFREDHPITYDL